MYSVHSPVTCKPNSWHFTEHCIVNTAAHGTNVCMWLYNEVQYGQIEDLVKARHFRWHIALANPNAHLCCIAHTSCFIYSESKVEVAHRNCFTNHLSGNDCLQSSLRISQCPMHQPPVLHNILEISKLHPRFSSIRFYGYCFNLFINWQMPMLYFLEIEIWLMWKAISLFF